VNDGEDTRMAWWHAVFDVGHDRAHDDIARAHAGLEHLSLPPAGDRNYFQLGGSEASSPPVLQRYALVRRHSNELHPRSHEGEEKPRVARLREQLERPIEQRGADEVLDLGLPAKRLIGALISRS
jgi:hypothetical protein